LAQDRSIPSPARALRRAVRPRAAMSALPDREGCPLLQAPGRERAIDWARRVFAHALGLREPGVRWAVEKRCRWCAGTDGSSKRCASPLCLCICLVVLAVLLTNALTCGMRYAPFSQTAFLVEKGLPFLNWWSLPGRKSWKDHEALRGEALENFTMIGGDGSADSSFSSFLAGDAARKMYEGTRVGGLFESVPEPLRGVFWKRGSPDAEELTAMQYGQWFEKERILVSTVAPFSSGWAYGKPRDAPHSGRYYGIDSARHGMALFYKIPFDFSFGFGECPADRGCNSSADNNSSEASLAFADIQIHPLGFMGISYKPDLISAFLPWVPKPIAEAVYNWTTSWVTLEESSEDLEPGSKFRVHSFLGVAGGCSEIEAFTYDLVKVIDKDGRPFEPYYTEFVEYMGEVPILLFTGFPTHAAREVAIRGYEGFKARVIRQALKASLELAEGAAKPLLEGALRGGAVR